MCASECTETVGRPATPLSRSLASIHSWQDSPGLNPREILRTIDQLIRERLWENELGWDGKPMTLTRALAAPWPIGVGISEPQLERVYELAKDAKVDPELVQRVKDGLAGVPLPHPGRPKKVVVQPLKAGRDVSYIRRRLHRDHPELYERVAAGELSPNAAAIKAGFRKPKATIPVDTAQSAIDALLRRFPPEELMAALVRGGQG